MQCTLPKTNISSCRQETPKGEELPNHHSSRGHDVGKLRPLIAGRIKGTANVGFPLKTGRRFLGGDLPTWAFHVWFRGVFKTPNVFSTFWLVGLALPTAFQLWSLLTTGNFPGTSNTGNVFSPPDLNLNLKKTPQMTMSCWKHVKKHGGKLWTSFIFCWGGSCICLCSQVLLLLDFLTTESMTPFWSLERKSSHFHFILCPGFPFV